MQPQLDLFGSAEPPKPAPAKTPRATKPKPKETAEPMPAAPVTLDLTAPPQPDPEPPAPQEPVVLSVSQLTRSIRSLIEDQIGELWVEGEVSNLRKQSSGHQYFTLKDAGSQLSCVLFAGQASQMRGINLTDGQCVQVFGQVTVYEARGQYQLVVRIVRNKGEGLLQAKFEALKARLASEGLFEPDRKRPLPRFPKVVGVVTSPTGAALKDFLNVLHRRHPGIEVIINPVRVQGAGASREIAQAVREFSEPEKYHLPPVEVIVVTRGGGSIEDLWEFNEEVVARAIAAASVPVVSAVGHEIDFTIADFVADLRAPTPSAAAEILAADRVEVLSSLRQQAARLHRTMEARFDLLTAQVRALASSAALREPERRVAELRQTTDRLAEIIERRATEAWERPSHLLKNLSLRLQNQSPENKLAHVRQSLTWFGNRLGESILREMENRKTRLERTRGILSALSPEGTLLRGYTITLDASGKPITRAENVSPGATLRTRFADGEVESEARIVDGPPPGQIERPST